MCFVLTVAVPANQVERIGEVFGPGFQTRPTGNQSVTEALPAGYEARVVTSGMCSCDLYARPRTQVDPDPDAHLRRKYKKLGWSEAKIQRAVDQAAGDSVKSTRPISGFRNDVAQSLRTLCRVAGSVAFLVHWYSGDIETERLPLSKAKRCDCAELSARTMELVEDEVLVAAARRAR
jgi:hypothetical protein